MKSFVKFLYWKSPLSLLLHFAINLSLGLLFAHLYSSQMHADAITAGWVRIGFTVLFIAYSIGTVKGIDTFDGYLIDFFWANTHVVAKNGLWPMYLYPIFKFDEKEKVNSEKTDILIPAYVVGDLKNLGLEASGSIRWEMGPDPEDSAKFTETDKEAFFRLMAQKAKNSTSSTIRTNNYRLETSILRDNDQYCPAILSRMNPTQIRTEFGIIVKEVLINIVETEETKKILVIETKGQAYMDEVQKYMRNTGCNFDQAKNAVDSALNGATVINMTGGGMPILNLGGLGTTPPRTP